MYDPIRPVKNMTSVARNSHIATLPGETGGCWTAVTAAGVACSASASGVDVGAAGACAIAGSTSERVLQVALLRQRVQQQQRQDRGQVHERRPQQSARGLVGD